MTTLPSWAARLLRKELRYVAEGMEFDREAAVKLLALLAPRRKNEKQKATQKRKLQGAAARRAASAAIRALVFDRADVICELCSSVPATQLHHMEGGSGRRRQTETTANCMAVCRWCHTEWHENGAVVFADRVKQWAAVNGYPLPSIIRKAEASAQLPGRAAR
jgi:hypothetical protein